MCQSPVINVAVHTAVKVYARYAEAGGRPSAAISRAIRDEQAREESLRESVCISGAEMHANKAEIARVSLRRSGVAELMSSSLFPGGEAQRQEK